MVDVNPQAWPEEEDEAFEEEFPYDYPTASEEYQQAFSENEEEYENPPFTEQKYDEPTEETQNGPTEELDRVDSTDAMEEYVNADFASDNEKDVEAFENEKLKMPWDECADDDEECKDALAEPLDGKEESESVVSGRSSLSVGFKDSGPSDDDSDIDLMAAQASAISLASENAEKISVDEEITFSSLSWKKDKSGESGTSGSKSGSDGRAFDRNRRKKGSSKESGHDSSQGSSKSKSRDLSGGDTTLIAEEISAEEEIDKKPIIRIGDHLHVSDNESEVSVTEIICRLQDKSRHRMTLKERYLGSRKMAGAGQYMCTEKTEERSFECLPPGQFFGDAIDTFKLWGIRENAVLSREEFIVLMRRMENHHNNDYVRLVYAWDYQSRDFNPYSFKIKKFKELDQKNYYTLSKYGVLYFCDGLAEYFPTLQFETQMHMFDRIRQIKFFSLYRIWKAFSMWRVSLRHRKIKQQKSMMILRSFLTKRPLRLLLQELNAMCEKIQVMSFLKLENGVTESLANFNSKQTTRMEYIRKSLKKFSSMVTEMTGAACRAHLIEEGFSPDEYPREMEFCVKQLETPLANLLKPLNTSNYPGQWLSYSELMRKRRVCTRLSDFIRLVDYIVQKTVFRLMKNSMFHLMMEMDHKVKFVPKEYNNISPTHTELYATLKESYDKYSAYRKVSASEEPIFDVGCNWNDNEMICSPPLEDYVSVMNRVFNEWKKVAMEYKNIINNKVFSPYTEPILNGVLENRACGKGPDMKLLFENDTEINNILEVVVQILQHGFHISKQYFVHFEHVRKFCLKNQNIDLEEFSKDRSVEKFNRLLKRYQKQSDLVKSLDTSKSMGVLRINNAILTENAEKTINRCLAALHEVIIKTGARSVNKLGKRIQLAIKKLEKFPKTADQYVDYLLFLDELGVKMETIESDMDVCAEIFDLMEIYRIRADEDVPNFASLQPLVVNLRGLMDKQTLNRENLVKELLEKLKGANEVIFRDYDIIQKALQDPSVLSPLSFPKKMARLLNEYKNRLMSHQDRAAKFNKYQKQLKLEVTDFEVLDPLLTAVKLRHQLWKDICSWKEDRKTWGKAVFSELDHEEITRQVNEYVKSIQQLEKGLPKNKVVPILKRKVDDLRAQLPLIANLHNPNLKRRHWEVLERAMNQSLTDENVTFDGLVENGVSLYTDLIQEMSAQASAESSLEALLQKVEDAWKDVVFIVLPHKDQRDVFILGGTDDIQTLLDDSNVNMATISSSRHVGPIKHKVDEWCRLLDLFGRSLEEWLNCQRNWIYLESIFCAPDIQRQLPNEAKMFAQVDKSWRDIMSRTNKMPAALRAGTQPGLLEALQVDNEMLDQIMKCLDDYLESKRVIFPRFYFLSNEELLEILAQTRNPQAVQPHLRKCFDAIQKLEFGGSGVTLDVISMYSPEDERVQLTKGLKARGNVENWLGKVEEAMFVSLKKIMRSCLADYHVEERENWLQKFPSQCVLTISQLMWAQFVHQILDGPGNRLNGMKEFENTNFENLNKLAAMVRGVLPPLVRAVLCALITIDVHARDIITSLVQKKVERGSNFEWLKQLRYYWDKDKEVVVAKMANAQYFYGYEYLGASPRLVITPLTDRCYLCLMGALQLDLGGAPAGPAGTGKTETTKDLAKSLAFMCVVFNCSEGLDYKMMGRFFSGLAQSGGWCCFDEFNRIDIEVLSVIAQQLITIRLAKVARLQRFVFEGREIKLVRTCAAFITMNPGYAGRTELPDNLKALFRPISMMVPDYTLIAEVILYSEGFESSKSLANKMTQMYKLCSEQLSQQDHYDFGMRAVKSVLVMAGSLKRSNPDINENIVLIRALRDSNLPKFLANDAVLLQGIIQDLFPGVVIPEQDYGRLQREAEKCAQDRGLQAPECFIRKVIQFYETLVVRHGVMLVGPTGGGKTSIYEVLKAALTSMFQSRVEGYYYRPVDTYILNPKAVSLGELYGEVNPLTLEWKDGLLGIMVRNTVKPKNTYHQWIICDGPVDAIWIENMNTVLDDNKMLCLANSERIKLTNWVRMMFEVQDLSQASPATVSRCGMVYVDSKEMGWRPYVKSWIQKYLGTQEMIKKFIWTLFDKYIDDGFLFVKRACQEIMPQSDMGKISMLCSILQALIVKKGLDYEMEKPKLLQFVCQIFVFSYLWSVGGNIHERNYDMFDQFIRTQFSAEQNCKLPSASNLWSYYNNFELKKMEAWEAIMPPFTYNPSISFVDVLVPTVDTVRFGFLMELLLSVDRAVLYTGPTGTGKSAIAKYVLGAIAPKYSYIPVFINFSAQTTSKRTQEMIEGKMEKRKKTLLSAPMGRKIIVMIDDLNMPRLDRYGAQPSLELLRQLLNFNGLYDRNKMFWKELSNIILSSACAPPGGGRNAVTPRLLRHFCMLAIPTPNQNVLTQIYKAIMKGFLEEFQLEVKEMSDKIVSASISTYQFMMTTFLPTPSKSHYVFNMRDLSKCIQGVLQANKFVQMTKTSMIRLYYHECQRVFHDRLTDDTDRLIFNNSLSELCTQSFKESIDTEEMSSIIFGDFMKINVERENRQYDEITNREKLKQVLVDYLDEYNVSTSKELNLVFFWDAAIHVTRITRILRLDRGNALLVGVGGTGKQSLTKLSSYIQGYDCFQIELMRGYDYSSFHDDLKKLYETAGMNNLPMVFLFTDTQIAYEEFLEDINNILNSGEVPNLLEPEDQERMIAGIRADAKNLGLPDTKKDTLYDYLIRRIRSNLHIVLCMSPVGDSFRIRCRMFPSLVNCCTINWFSEWPTEALLSVANTFMSKIELGKVSPEAMADICVLVHESVTKMSEKFYQEMRRRYYTTPSSYLELINLYTSMLNDRRERIFQGKARIQNGLTKILETNVLVKDMKIQLRELEPRLVEKSRAVEELMLVLAEDQAAADVVRRNVQVEEAAAKEKAVETQAIAEDAQRDLAEALPALEAAVKSLDMLDKNDIVEIRQFQKPPELVRTVMETVCILFGSKPDWNSSRLLLSDSGFLKKLYDFDKNNVSEATLKKLKVYIDNPQFTPEKVAKVSKACKSICLWVRAIDLYAKVFKTVEPKRNRYLGAQAELDQVMETLKQKQSQLNEVEKKIAALQERYENSMNEKTILEDGMTLTRDRLSRAGRLTNALASEQTRWAETVQNFDTEMKNLIGDVFVGAACVAYFGAFTSSYRQVLVTEWVERCVQLGLPVSREFSLTSFADPFEIRVWNASGLPRDNTSTENAILATRGRRWPLMIDPQDQANRWIKQMEGTKGLKVLKLSDGNFMRTMENCIRLGNPCLLEEIKETLDPSLEPILLRQIFVQSGRTMIRLGDSNVDYDKNFRLYMTTKMANPHYLPEICIKVTIINFTVTISGLEDQLLSDVVSLERPDLESQRAALISQINSDKNQLVLLETKVLKLLFASEGNILDDEELIDALNESKETSKVIIKRVAESEETEKSISIARERYRPVASRGSVLYFVVAQLAELDPMYQYSLKFFTQVFNQCIATAEKSEELEERLRILKKETTLATYTNISRGLFEKDKLVFSFMLCIDVLKSRSVVADEEWNFFLRGGTNVESGRTKKPAQATWITNQQWNNACDLESSFDIYDEVTFACLKEPLRIKIGSFKTVIFKRKDGKEKTNDKWDKKLSKFQKLILIKALAEEKLVAAITEFVRQELGQKFIESPAIDLAQVYKDLNKITPLIFVLSQGSDPMAGFYRFASEFGYSDKVSAISLGQGQGPVATAMIKQACVSGDWVFLQNCHLASSWLPSLEKIVKKMTEAPIHVHDSFKLFLSSMPTSTFPVSILQESVKITNEPPKGLRANVRRALVEMEKDFFEDNILGVSWRRIVFGICVFHAVIQERKKFGPLGWNIKYEFNDSDRQCCLLNLEIFCKEGIIPWDALEYITGQITYGGRITDNWDQRCLTTILKGFFSRPTLHRDYKYSPSGVYYAPLAGAINDYINYTDKLPIIEEPEIFGMHENANITYQQQESFSFMASILTVQPKVSGGSASSASDDIAYDLAASLESKLPQKLDIDKANPSLFVPDARHRTPSLTIFLQQEVDRFNKLLGVLKTTLEQLKKGIRGLVVMSEDLEKMYQSFLNNQVPDLWKNVSYGSLKSLSSWFKDYQLRISFMENWLFGNELPSSYWISGFFFQQGFLTAVLQTYARRFNLPIDQLKFNFTVAPLVKEQLRELDHVVEKTIVRPRDGVLIHGLFLEAARWDMQEMNLADSFPGEMNPLLPIIHFLPSMELTGKTGTYTTPLYKTSIRAGVLSTTGHSTNFIVSIRLPSRQPEDYWILKGTALLSQLTD